MYGMIHNAARELAVAQWGEDAWRRILDRAGLDEIHFIAGDVYSDEVTFGLMGAITEETGVPLETLLFDFGRYWIIYASESAFASVMRTCGADFQSFVAGLDRMHRSIRTAMPQAQMPSFEVLSNTDGRVEILYASTRQGLEPFVDGLFVGLLDHFKEAGEISHAPRNDEGVVFTVKLAKRRAA